MWKKQWNCCHKYLIKHCRLNHNTEYTDLMMEEKEHSRTGAARLKEGTVQWLTINGDLNAAADGVAIVNKSGHNVTE